MCDDGPTTVEAVNPTLKAKHYLGPARRGVAWSDRFGVMVVSSPTSRHIPSSWLELTRWCLLGIENGGSMQWSSVRRWIVDSMPNIDTVVSYSDPGHGHTGALYRATGWLWAPTWHRLRPPPTGNGDWGTGRQSVKDRWIYPLRRSGSRMAVLSIKDASLTRRFPWAEYVEPKWKRGKWSGGGGDYARAIAEKLI